MKTSAGYSECQAHRCTRSMDGSTQGKFCPKHERLQGEHTFYRDQLRAGRSAENALYRARESWALWMEHEREVLSDQTATSASSSSSPSDS